MTYPDREWLIKQENGRAGSSQTTQESKRKSIKEATILPTGT
jgi:hypothetical protein